MTNKSNVISLRHIKETTSTTCVPLIRNSGKVKLSTSHQSKPDYGQLFAHNAAITNRMKRFGQVSSTPLHVESSETSIAIKPTYNPKPSCSTRPDSKYTWSIKYQPAIASIAPVNSTLASTSSSQIDQKSSSKQSSSGSLANISVSESVSRTKLKRLECTPTVCSTVSSGQKSSSQIAQKFSSNLSTSVSDRTTQTPSKVGTVEPVTVVSSIPTKDDKKNIQEIMVATLDQMKEKLFGFIINRVEKNECKIHDKAIENATMRKKLDKIQVKFENMKEENDKLKEKLDKELSLREKHINSLEQNGKSNNVCITGLDDTSGETAEMTTKKVITMINSKLPIKISENEIDISHRLGKFDNNKKRPIIVKFVRRHVQTALMKTSKMLKGTDIYVNEDLTKLNRNVLTSMRKKSMDTVERAWSFNGKLFWKDKHENIENGEI